MDLKSFLFGQENKISKLPNYNNQQNQVLSQLLNQIMQMGGQGGGANQALQYLQGLLDPNSQAYQDQSAPYMREFNEQTIPGLAERFGGGFGAQSGALSSSGFGQSLSAAGAGLQERLASLRSQLQSGAAGGLLNQFNQMTGQGLGASPFSYLEKQGNAGLLPSAFGGFASGIGGGFGSGLGKQLFGG